ncbi:MAG: hypothetical protein ABI831_04375 [Betaproteobacteria bacterium]
MLVLTGEHVRGKVAVEPLQPFCTIEGRRILVDDDPEGKRISGCPNLNPAIGIRPCVTTLKVKEGYSEFVRIGKRSLCLDSVHGLTDGTPPGLVKYIVQTPGQTLVRCTL